MDRWYTRVWNAMNSSSESSQRRLLLAGSFIVMLFLLALGGFRVSTVEVDTMTYITAGDNFFAGVIDEARTPVYPVICHLAGFLGSAAGLYAVVLLQAVAFLASVVWLHKTARMMFPSHNLVAFIATALYAWNVGTVHYVLVIMTESLSLSAVVLMFWLIVKGMKQAFTSRDAIVLMTLYIVMLFLRPFFICFAPLLVLFYIFVRKQLSLKTVVAFWGGLAVVAAAYVGYSCAYKAQYGVFTTSCVPDINLNAQLYQAGLVDTAMWKKDSFNLVEEHANNREVLMANKGVWFRHMLDETLMSSRQLFPKMVLSHGGKMAQPLSLQISGGMLYLITLLFAIVTLVRWRRCKADVRLDVLLLFTIVVTVVTSVWGAFGIYTRLMLPCYSALCLVLGRFFSRFKE